MVTKTFEKMKAAAARKIYSATKLIEEYAAPYGTDDFTICGYRQSPNKKGVLQDVFDIVEGNASFYATSWQKANILPLLYEDHKTVEGINAHLKAHPQVWSMSKTTTAAGKPWIYTELIDELDRTEAENGDGQSGTETGAD